MDLKLVFALVLLFHINVTLCANNTAKAAATPMAGGVPGSATTTTTAPKPTKPTKPPVVRIDLSTLWPQIVFIGDELTFNCFSKEWHGWCRLISSVATRNSDIVVRAFPKQTAAQIALKMKGIRAETMFKKKRVGAIVIFVGMIDTTKSYKVTPKQYGAAMQSIMNGLDDYVTNNQIILVIPPPAATAHKPGRNDVDIAPYVAALKTVAQAAAKAEQGRPVAILDLFTLWKDKVDQYFTASTNPFMFTKAGNDAFGELMFLQLSKIVKDTQGVSAKCFRQKFPYLVST